MTAFQLSSIGSSFRLNAYKYIYLSQLWLNSKREKDDGNLIYIYTWKYSFILFDQYCSLLCRKWVLLKNNNSRLRQYYLQFVCYDVNLKLFVIDTNTIQIKEFFRIRNKIYRKSMFDLNF